MQRLPVSIVVFVLALAAAACAGSGGSAAAPAKLATWDQARVTQIARQLSTASDAWQLAVRQEQEDQIGGGAAEAGLSLAKSATALSEQSRSLAERLEAGDGFEQTRNTYRSLHEVVDDSEVAGQRSELEDSTLAAWSRVDDLVRQLEPYYGR
jgi:hypothetical protein